METPKPYLLSLLFLCSLGGYVTIGYGIERSNFDFLIVLFAILFLCYFLGLKWLDTQQKIKWGIIAAILFRAALLFSIPTLSDDFYRFIWDGRLLAHGLNPFAHTPQYLMKNGLPHFLPVELYKHLSAVSQLHFTVYPPVCQYIFGLSAELFGASLRGNIVVMKSIMLAFELGTFWMLKKLLRYFHLPLKYLLIYALNPLIIMELTGNLHFEGVMIFFLLASFYLFLKKQIWLGAICFLLTVNTKLIPLMLLPYLCFSLGWKRSGQLIGVLAAGTLLLHIPFLDGAFLGHFTDSLALYFQSFEFNASIYYIVRWIGYQFTGYNIIHTAAPVLAAIATLIIIGISWKYRNHTLKNLPCMYIIVVAVYYFFSTTIHPWYVTSLVAFVPLAGLLFPVAWSVVIPLTYIAYSTVAYHENIWLVGVEYLVVIGVIFYDYRLPKRLNYTTPEECYVHNQ